ncbi:MAG: PAS domain-containing protein, partial [Burkholderiaceae bacterium]|nr:PAS domain-containing protein [Burkholderiaceae bacterium]
LKLLHELQVHQVESDLQHEQTGQELHQLQENLAYFTLLFDLAPFAYLCLDTHGVVIAANQKAVHWLAPEPGSTQGWAGQRIEDLLAPESRAAVQGIFAALRDGQTPSEGEGQGQHTCRVQSQSGGTRMHAVVTATPGARHVLMALMPLQQ